MTHKITMQEYQETSRMTRAGEADITTAALGLTGESGEVADIVKKWRAHGHTLDETKIIDELGDVLWYIALAADALGTTMDTIAYLNFAKLRRRYPNGFETERSINRDPIQLDETAA